MRAAARPRRRAGAAALALAVALGAAGPARAAPPGRLEVSLAGLGAFPLGPLRGASVPGVGVDVALVAARDSAAWLAWRLEGGFVSLRAGSETALRPPGAVEAVSTAIVTNRLMWAALGPEARLRARRARLYAFAEAGIGHSLAHAAVRSGGDNGYYPETFDHPPGGNGLAWAVGAGARLALTRGLALDLGAGMVGLGRTRFALDPPLTLGPDQRERFRTTVAEPSLVALRLGVAYATHARP